MSPKRPPLPIIILVLLALIAAGVYSFLGKTQPAQAGLLTASGTVETSQITIAPELAGRVVEVLASEGDSVNALDVLFRQDDTLLQAQRTLASASLESAKSAAVTASAALESAKAQYELTLINALNEEKATRTSDWGASNPTEYNQPAWYFNQSEKLAALQNEAQAAATDQTSAEENLQFVQQKASSDNFLAAEERLANARANFEITKAVLDQSSSASQELRDAAQNTHDDAISELDDAQQAYDDALTTEGAADVLQARAELSVARERASLAQDRVRALQTGLNAPKVLAAQKTVDQAQAAAEQSGKAITQAEANLAVLDAQLAKLVITAPAAGVILSRSVEPGEMVTPGAAAFGLAPLNSLTLTVYIPEDRYGEVSLGQQVDVLVDSFPGETFQAQVIHIADQAEFTPRNVQTSEGRKSTVFAVKLKLEDASGRLKPGMPADVTFK